MGEQQTAVDFFYDFIKIHCDNDVELYETCVRALKQAKQMEKEQIIEAHKQGNKNNGWALRHEHEQYYNETYAQQ